MIKNVVKIKTLIVVVVVLDFVLWGPPSKCKQQNELRPVKPTTTPQSHSVVNQGFPILTVNTTQ